eukprot:TRINITY_DN3461_c0_g1_i1.p1 TRINITY_DN3461_c0_g1~~TRINITY_DN3461_c0_g1_i1.p1  ORF type:complete len:396 (+),score=76.15 TRINITY_DN3461_c0_g1_i1:53-1240(+)
MTLLIYCVLSLLLIGSRCVTGESLGEIIEKHPNLTKFNELLKQDGLHQAFIDRSVTIFAPSDAAFSDSNSFRDPESLLLNHFCNLALRKAVLPNKLSSLVTGNPPLWVRKEQGDVFINQARIWNPDLLGVSRRGEDQVLHIIDSLLVPLVPLSVSSGDYYVHLDARKVLSKSTLYDLQGHSLRVFSQRAEENRKSGMFSVNGRHTFFMPIDEAFEVGPLVPSGLRAASIRQGASSKIRPELISTRVLEGHILPNTLLFSSSAPSREYQSVAWEPKEGGIRVNVSLQRSPSGNEVLVRSNTLVGDPAHARGIVLAKVLLGDIPVANGVLHLIDRPLMIVDKTLFEAKAPSRATGSAALQTSFATREDYLRRLYWRPRAERFFFQTTRLSSAWKRVD